MYCVFTLDVIDDLVEHLLLIIIPRDNRKLKFQALDAMDRELSTFEENTVVDVRIKFFNKLGNYSIEWVGSDQYFGFLIRDEAGQSIRYAATYRPE